MTASKVMRKTSSISANTHQKVQKAADELAHVPNRLAGSLGSRSSDIVAVVLPSINDSIFGDVVSGISAVLRPSGYISFIGKSQLEGQIEEDILRTVLSLHPAGLILTGGIVRSENALYMLASWNCPTVQIWGNFGSDFDGMIGPNHEDAGRLIADHFRGRGYQPPAYIGAELQKDLCAAIPYEAYRDALSACGMPQSEMADEKLPRQWETGQILTERLMRDYPKNRCYLLSE